MDFTPRITMDVDKIPGLCIIILIVVLMSDLNRNSVEVG